MKVILNSIISFFIISSLYAKQEDSLIIDKLRSIYKKTGIEEANLFTNSKIILEETELSFIGKDIYGRNQYLFNDAAKSWFLMEDAAAKEGFNLMFVSGFRTYNYQANIIKRKIKRGMLIENILKQNKLPGYSEHHSGRAIDITNNKVLGLYDDFKYSNEYKWMVENANFYGFRLTYKEDNNSGIMFEPWHWYYYK